MASMNPFFNSNITVIELRSLQVKPKPKQSSLKKQPRPTPEQLKRIKELSQIIAQDTKKNTNENVGAGSRESEHSIPLDYHPIQTRMAPTMGPLFPLDPSIIPVYPPLSPSSSSMDPVDQRLLDLIYTAPSLPSVDTAFTVDYPPITPEQALIFSTSIPKEVAPLSPSLSISPPSSRDPSPPFKTPITPIESLTPPASCIPALFANQRRRAVFSAPQLSPL